jgi:hypothetical protein
VFNFYFICGCLFALNSNVTGSTVLTEVERTRAHTTLSGHHLLALRLQFENSTSQKTCTAQYLFYGTGHR